MATPQEMVAKINANAAAAKADAELAQLTKVERDAARKAAKEKNDDPDAPPAPDPSLKYPEFMSTTGRNIAIALLSGHTASVSADEPTRLHPRFHRRAVELGAMPASIAKQMQEEMAGDLEEASSQNRDEIIIKNIGQMVSQADINPNLQATLFTNDGRPDCVALAQRCGFQVRAPERDRAWEIYQGEVA